MPANSAVSPRRRAGAFRLAKRPERSEERRMFSKV